MDRFEIQLDHPAATYFPGQRVTGTLIFNTKKSQNVEAINIRVNGEISAGWKHYNQLFQEHIMYASKMVNLDGLEQPVIEKNVIPQGDHSYPFSFPIPADCVPSFEGKNGAVRYKIHVEILRIKKSKMEVEKVFSVLPYVDLNNIPRAGLPLEDIMSWLPKKNTEVKVKFYIPKRGFVAGDTIPVSVDIENGSSSKIKEITMKLIQINHFEAQQQTSHTAKEFFRFNRKNIEEEISSIQKKCEVKEHLETLRFELPIPKETRPTFKTKLIHLAYKVAISVGNDKKLECELPIILGTVPVQPRPPSYSVAVGMSGPPCYEE
ncbi:hypothetical protein GCK72_004814 [Caenorhabditis remanei]|uniref:Arrestin C-terminal-like domain-containing protein n=2 Tax=Caenorhabditis TaxID=6237 RepID=E3MZU0_CAERE|nr:hypothetical protein GCK72_004814 [Caenorhabditis remanei]EFP13141.1 hypothetical protein CRE_07723 [Caenorhabditis remanei]KAF1764864.1 hypothetical protein GCK72_004814 [Caenorhabditis remanei]